MESGAYICHQEKERNMNINKSHNKIVSTLNDYESIFFEPMWGNNGDRLIKEAALELFKATKLKLTISPDISDAIVINGGGSMTTAWGGLDVLKYYLTEFDKPIIVLPSSFMLSDDELEKLSNEIDKRKSPVYIFCRERNSFEKMQVLKSHNLNIELEHDMAFYLMGTDVKNKLHVSSNKKNGVLVVERRDAERSTNIQPAVAYSIPFKSFIPMFLKRPIKRYLQKTHTPKTDFYNQCISIVNEAYRNLNSRKVTYLDVSEESLASFQEFVNFISTAEVVFTTRLHVAILCHLLHKPCYLKPTGGGYGKNENVYMHSLFDSSFVKLLTE
jgi:exopolysaccharide biosynthesis predicted pyruvyltransferase EpsI